MERVSSLLLSSGFSCARLGAHACFINETLEATHGPTDQVSHVVESHTTHFLVPLAGHNLIVIASFSTHCNVIAPAQG
jgi:hypothetical protein